MAPSARPPRPLPLPGAPRGGIASSQAAAAAFVASAALLAAAAASTASFGQRRENGGDEGEGNIEERRRRRAYLYPRGRPVSLIDGFGTMTGRAALSSPLPGLGSRWHVPIAAPSAMVAQCEAAERAFTDSAAALDSSSSAETAAATPAQRQSRSPPPPLPPSRIRRLLHALRLSDLPVPRALSPSDPVFDYPALRAGLRRRARDEVRLRALQGEAIAARDSGDPERINGVFGRISAVAYGEGVTPQEREDFLVKYGCTGWTDEILTYLVNLAWDRGIVEIGAGAGQWARAIEDRHAEMTKLDNDGGAAAHRNSGGRGRGKSFDFIMPYDDMTDLPLSPKVYHRHTKPYHDNFHHNVRRCTSHVDAVRKWESRGRTLLLVYPPPGPFAVETVRAYVDVYPDGNDTVVYVGEGRGGANADDGLFDYFLNDGDWALVKVMDVRPSLGGKGYECMFVLRKLKKCEQHGSRTMYAQENMEG